MIVRIVDIVRTAEHTICNLHELRLIYSSAMDVYPKALFFFLILPPPPPLLFENL